MRLFVGTPELKVDYVAAAHPLEASFFVVDASAYQGKLGVSLANEHRAPGPLVAGAAPDPGLSRWVLGAGAAVGGVCVAKALGASAIVTVLAAAGAPLLLFGLLALAAKPPQL